MLRPTRDSQRASQAFTLVETALVMCIAGTLLAVMLPTFLRAVQTSKVAEATSQLDALYRLSASYYALPRTLGEQVPQTVHCLALPAGPMPATPSAERAVVGFDDPNAVGYATWHALGFAPSEPLRFRYTYTPARTDCSFDPNYGRPALQLRAEGDLDGDGVYSNFERRGFWRSDGELVAEPMLHMHDRIE